MNRPLRRCSPRRRRLFLSSSKRLPTAWRDPALGSEVMREGRLAEAEAHLARTLERMPALIAACENLAMVQAYRGDPVAARRTGDRCQEIFPDPDLAKDLAGMGVGQSP